MSNAPSTYAVLQVTGADANQFLRNQLTVDVQRLGQAHHALAAWCDAKGRALCLQRIIPLEHGYLLLLPAELAAPMSKRLRMFVLRAQVDISDVTQAWRISGITDNPAGEPLLPADGELTPCNGGWLLGLSTGAMRLSQSPAEPDSENPVNENAWQLAQIDAGLPEIGTATSGLFVPQMLNLHWLDAIDFDKGCYPGQEVVARLQYRGRLTRRMFRMQWHGSQPQPGDDVFDADGAKQGTVVRAAHCGVDDGRLLAVVRVDACNEALSTNEARLELLDLPYPTDEIPVPG